jgi:hypothetical protein
MGQGTFIISIDMPVDHISLKLIQSNVNWKTNVNHCWGNRKSHYLKATHIVWRPSRLTHLTDSTHNTSHYADMTVDVALISSDIFICRLSKSTTSIWITLLVRKPIKGKNKPTDHANGVTKKCCKYLCCWKRRKTPLRQIHDGHPMTDPCSYRMVSTAESNSALISCSVWGCAEYYVNQNDERKLPQAVQKLWFSYQWNWRLIICLYLVKIYLWIFI